MCHYEGPDPWPLNDEFARSEINRLLAHIEGLESRIEEADAGAKVLAEKWTAAHEALSTKAAEAERYRANLWKIKLAAKDAQEWARQQLQSTSHAHFAEIVWMAGQALEPLAALALPTTDDTKEPISDFCERIYRETGGVTPALRAAYDLYVKLTTAPAPTTDDKFPEPEGKGRIIR